MKKINWTKVLLIGSISCWVVLFALTNLLKIAIPAGVAGILGAVFIYTALFTAIISVFRAKKQAT